MKHELMKLPFEYEALEPHMSKETLTYHHDKHHQTYVNKLNELIVDTKFEDSDLVEIVKQADGGIFNNAAQVYNHDFFWNSITPNKTTMSSELEKKLIATFGSVDTFKNEFLTKATTHFGAGWVWLVADDKGALSIVTTVNAGCPLTAGLTPLLTCDVWEHAYYIDYRNVRPDYLTHWWSLVNWDFVSENTAKI
jgi:superoxide dismutase, Fe-Mn family